MEYSSVKAGPAEISIEELVEQAKLGQEESISALVDHIQQPLYRFCFYLSKDPRAAEDLCQETLIRILTQLKKLKDPTKFRSWMFQISKNLFLDHLRVSRRTEPLTEEPIQGETPPELHLHIARTLDALEPQERLILLLVDLEGHTYQEAAGILDISVEAVTSRIYRARQTFLNVFDRDERKRSH